VGLPYEGAMLRYLRSWIDQLRWQRPGAFQNLAFAGSSGRILNYCRTKVRFGVVEAINGQHQDSSEKGPRLQESWLPAAQGPAHGGQKD
jgi:hypothetical protein